MNFIENNKIRRNKSRMDEIYTDIIFQVVDAKIDSILRGDEIVPGHNGPYYDQETNVRNIAHWIGLCACCYAVSKVEKYRDAVQILANKLYYSPYLNEKTSVFVSRISLKDSINGTIGPAWIIEGLIYAAEILEDEKYYELAVKVFKAQHFVSKNSLWTRIDENGMDIGFDLTYNHELWFAAAGSLILDYRFDSGIDIQIKKFLNMSVKGMRVLSDGIINHYIDTWVGLKRTISFNKNFYEEKICDRFGKPSMRYKEEGYHLFCMYAFAILQNRYSNHTFFKTKKFQKALSITFSEEFLERLDHANESLDSTMIKKENIDKRLNAYGYPYNAPGFELPFIAKRFRHKDGKTLAREAFERQIELTYNAQNKDFSRNTEDETVLTARLYELARTII